MLSARQLQRLLRTPHAPGKKKFGSTKPWLSNQSSSLNATEREQLNWLSGHCVAQSTWRTYSTASNLFRWFCSERNIAPELLATPDTITRFVLWLSFTRKVSQATITVYLAGLRQLHIQQGVDCPALRSEFTKMLLQAKKNCETRATEMKPTRQPATVDVMNALKSALRDSAFDAYTRRMIWTVSTILFFGTLRSGELLCVSTATFDPRFCACSEDITLAVNMATGVKKLVLTVKTPKEERAGASATVEIFQAKSENICAVASWEKWHALNPPLERGQPIFRHLDGSAFTQADLNKALKSLLPGSNISSHSFRIGAATEMGLRGFGDTDIKLAGRWSSKAFDRYVRKGKSRRSAVARMFSNDI